MSRGQRHGSAQALFLFLDGYTSIFSGELIGVIITPPITPTPFWGFHKRNSQEKLHLVVLSLLGKITQGITPKKPWELIGLINFTMATPENSWGVNCVILEGTVVFDKHWISKQITLPQMQNF